MRGPPRASVRTAARRAASTDDCLSSVDSAGGSVDSHSPTPPESPVLPRGPGSKLTAGAQWGAAEEEGHESGIGTASPPPSHAGRSK